MMCTNTTPATAQSAGQRSNLQDVTDRARAPSKASTSRGLEVWLSPDTATPPSSYVHPRIAPTSSQQGLQKNEKDVFDFDQKLDFLTVENERTHPPAALTSPFIVPNWFDRAPGFLQSPSFRASKQILPFSERCGEKVLSFPRALISVDVAESQVKQFIATKTVDHGNFGAVRFAIDIESQEIYAHKKMRTYNDGVEPTSSWKSELQRVNQHKKTHLIALSHVFKEADRNVNLRHTIEAEMFARKGVLRPKYSALALVMNGSLPSNIYGTIEFPQKNNVTKVSILLPKEEGDLGYMLDQIDATHHRALILSTRAQLFTQLDILGNIAQTGHFDVKKSNITCNRFGEQKITDFGCALPLDYADGTEVPSLHYGTYFTPDHFEVNHNSDSGTRRLTIAADFWSAGLALFDLASSPFKPPAVFSNYWLYLNGESNRLQDIGSSAVEQFFRWKQGILLGNPLDSQDEMFVQDFNDFFLPMRELHRETFDFLMEFVMVPAASIDLYQSEYIANRSRNALFDLPAADFQQMLSQIALIADSDPIEAELKEALKLHKRM